MWPEWPIPRLRKGTVGSWPTRCFKRCGLFVCFFLLALEGLGGSSANHVSQMNASASVPTAVKDFSWFDGCTDLLAGSLLVLQDYSNLTKADIFALALTVVSAAGADPLPTNGEKWHEIRQGKLPPIPQVLSQEFLSLLKVGASQLFLFCY